MSDTTPTGPALPSVHMNGTSKQELIDQQTAVIDAAYVLAAALQAACPHGRDYYPQGNGAWEAAMAEHRAIARQVLALQERAMVIAQHVFDQQSGR